MKTSDALMLGATMLKPLRGVFIHDAIDGGCALGMIEVAFHGIPKTRAGARGNNRWILEMRVGGVPLPCDCNPEYSLMGSCGDFYRSEDIRRTYQNVIVHLFNQHVCDGSWSIERLADYVRSVEPAEPSEEAQKLAEELTAIGIGELK